MIGVTNYKTDMDDVIYIYIRFLTRRTSVLQTRFIAVS